MPHLRLVCCVLVVFALQACEQNAPVTAPRDPQEAVSSLTFYETSNPRTLDPHTAGDIVSSRHVMHLYECLFEYGPFDDQTLQPCVAKKMPTYDPKTFTYTVELRHDVFFQDDPCFVDGKGRKLIASDVLISLKRLASLHNGGYWILEGKIAGLNRFRNDALELYERTDDGWIVTNKWHEHLHEDVSGLAAPDDHTVQITLTEPYPQLLHALALSYGAIIPFEAEAKYDLNDHPVGSGPYVLAESSESEFVYRRSANYRKTYLSDVPDGSPLKPYEGNRLPLTTELRYELIDNDWERLDDNFAKRQYPQMGLSSSYLDIYANREKFTKGQRNSDVLLPEWQERGLRLIHYPEPTLHYISFNMNDAVVGAKAGERGKAIRKAVAMGLNRSEYIEERLDGRGVPATQLVPPGIPSYDETNQMSGQVHDPKAARKLLSDAGFKVKEVGDAWEAIDPDTNEQIRFTILFRSTSGATKEAAVYYSDCLREVGIELDMQLMTFPEFLRAQDKGEGQAYDAGWVLDYPDAQNMMQLLYGPNKSPGINNASFDDERYNKLYEEMAQLDNSIPEQLAKKRELIGKMHEVLNEETPWVLMEYRETAFLQWGGVGAPRPNPFANNHRKYWAWER